MGSIFISYAREDLDFVSKLYDAMQRGGHEVWVDWEGIPPIGEWLAEIHRAIDSADACLFVLSPDFLDSEPCAAELKRALEQHKRLVPLIWREVDDKKVHPEMAKLNWIFIRETDDFQEAVDRLNSAIETDLEWVQEHTRLLRKAGEWKEHAENSSFALRGEDLAHFEAWLTEAGEKEPKPTLRQTEFVLASRRAATRRQRVIFSAIAIAIIVIAISSVWAYFSNLEKQRQEEIAAARKLLYRAEAERERPDGLAKSVRSAAKALKRFNGIGITSLEADAAVRKGLKLLPRKEKRYSPRFGRIEDINPIVLTDPMGRFLILRHKVARKPSLFIWDAEHNVALCRRELLALDSVSFYGVSSEARLVAIARQAQGKKMLTIVELEGCKPVARFEVPIDPLIVRLSSKGTYAAVARYAWARLWRVETGEEIRVDHEALYPYDIAFDPSEQHFAALYWDKQAEKSYVRVVDLANGIERARWMVDLSFLFVYKWPGMLKWWPDPKRLRLRSDEKDYIYDPKTGELRNILPKSNSITDSAGAWVADGIGSNTVHIRNARSGRKVGQLIHPTHVQTMAFRSDSRSMVTLSSRYYGNDYPIRVWHLDGTGSVTEIRQSERIDKIHFTKDSRLIYTSTPIGLQSWHLPQSDKEINLALRRSDVKISDPSSIGILNRYDIIRNKYQLEIIDRTEQSSVKRIGFRGKAFVTKVSRDGKWLAVIAKPPGSTRGGWELKVEIYGLQDQSPAREIPFPDFKSDEYADFLQFSSDGRFLITATNSLFRIWDIATLKPVAELFQSFPRVIAIQPDGGLVATTARNNMIRVWRISDGFEVIRIENDQPVKALAVSPDGRWLASLHEAGFVRLWAIRPADLISQACARLSSPCP